MFPGPPSFPSLALRTANNLDVAWGMRLVIADSAYELMQLCALAADNTDFVLERMAIHRVLTMAENTNTTLL